MEERSIQGRRCTNRRGAAEYLGRSLPTVNLLASPSRRTVTGWPAPVAVRDRQHWYALDDLDAFRHRHLEAAGRRRLARVHAVDLAGDPDEMVSAKDFRGLIDVTHSAWSNYVRASLPAWRRGRDGYLPRPDRERPAAHGMLRWWTRRRVQAWINQRPGSASSPGRPPHRT